MTINNVVSMLTNPNRSRPMENQGRLFLADMIKCPNLQRRMMVNQAIALGRVECTTLKRISMAERLCDLGQLQHGGTISSGGKWYKPHTNLCGTTTIGGPTVWFSEGPLASFELHGALTRPAPETFGKGDSGAICFQHPNTKLYRHWLYIKVPSKLLTGTSVYVSVAPSMIDVSA
jgi:hypothetical protein